VNSKNDCCLQGMGPGIFEIPWKRGGQGQKEEGGGKRGRTHSHGSSLVKWRAAVSALAPCCHAPELSEEN